MSTPRELLDISEKGWTQAAFDIPEADRAAYAQAANAVITMAQEDDDIRRLLDFKVDAANTDRTGQFGIGYPRHSTDKSINLHTGFQSRSAASELMPERYQPSLLHDFWDRNDAMLEGIETNTRRVLALIGAEVLDKLVFSEHLGFRGVHLRTVRYPGALVMPVGEEVTSGHTDVGLMTWHLYETHGGWLRGAVCPPTVISEPDSTERREKVQAIRSSMSLLEQADDALPFFVGANWSTFESTPEQLRDLPACYHAGFRPSSDEEIVSAYAEAVTGNDQDRVSVVSFMHPNAELLKRGIYIPATRENCRPKYETSEPA